MSSDLQQRRSDHRRSLRLGKHPNLHLQRAYNKYGVDDFIFKVLEFGERGTIAAREKYWLSIIKCGCFNIKPADDASKIQHKLDYSALQSKKFEERPELRTIIGEKIKALWQDPEYREKQTKALQDRKLNWKPNEEHLEKLTSSRLESDKWSDSIMFRKLSKEQYIELVELYLSNQRFGIVMELSRMFKVSKGVVIAAKGKYDHLE